jgi:hypothetical protein
MHVVQMVNIYNIHSMIDINHLPYAQQYSSLRWHSRKKTKGDPFLHGSFIH